MFHHCLNDAHTAALACEKHLHRLLQLNDDEEVKDLIRDASTLARRIDRLHHDMAMAEIAKADALR